MALTGQALDGLTAALTGSEALDVAGVAAITAGLVGRPLRRVVVLDEQ